MHIAEKGKVVEGSLSSRLKYLEDLRREAEKGLPQGEVEELIREAGCHLEDGIEGRLELGLDVDFAERDAVAAFGNARAIARQTIRRRLAGRDRARLIVLCVSHLLLYVGTLGFAFGMGQFTAGMVCFSALFCLPIFAGLAGFARRPATGQVVAVSLGASLASVAVYVAVFLNLGAFGGSGLVFRWQGSSLVAYNTKLIEERTEDRARFDALESVWVKQGRASGVYQAPFAVGDPLYGRVEYRQVPDLSAAEVAWAALQKSHFQRFSTDDLQRATEGISRAQAEPVANALSLIRPAVPYALILAAFVGTIDLLFGSAGAIFFTLLRKRRGVA